MVPRSSTNPRTRSILEAALKCFVSDGYDSASIEQICGMSGASVGSVYHHFGSKEGVASALFEEAVAAYQTGLLDLLAAGGDPDNVLADLVRHHLSWVKRNPDWARYMFQMGSAPATAAARPAVRRRNDQLFELLAGWAEPYVAGGQMVDVSAATMLALVLGPSHAMARAWLAGAGELDPKTIDDLASAVVRAVRPN